MTDGHTTSPDADRDDVRIGANLVIDQVEALQDWASDDDRPAAKISYVARQLGRIEHILLETLYWCNVEA